MKLVEFIHFTGSGNYCGPCICIIWLYFVYVCLGSTFTFSITMRSYVITRLLPQLASGMQLRGSSSWHSLGHHLLYFLYTSFFPICKFWVVTCFTFRRKEKKKPIMSFRSVSSSPAFGSQRLEKNIKKIKDRAYSDSLENSSLLPSDLEFEGLLKPAMLFLH